MRWYLKAMRGYARFQGRSPRVEFFEVFGGLFLLILVAGGMDRALLDDGTGSSMLFVHLVILAHILPVLAVTARRLHDLDWSGWFTLLNLVPMLGFVVLLLVLPRGVRGPNRFGADPLDSAAVHATQPQQPVRPSQAAPPPATTGSMATSAPVNVIGELERLAELHRTGSLSEAEFSVMKAQVMARAG